MRPWAAKPRGGQEPTPREEEVRSTHTTPDEGPRHGDPPRCERPPAGSRSTNRRGEHVLVARAPLWPTKAPPARKTTRPFRPSPGRSGTRFAGGFHVPRPEPQCSRP